LSLVSAFLTRKERERGVVSHEIMKEIQ